MQAQGRPSEEIERVVLSAVDFADTPADLMYIGAYLARLGQGDTDRTLSSRALKTFRRFPGCSRSGPSRTYTG